MTDHRDQLESGTDLDSVVTKAELDAALQRLVGSSSASSIARRAGVSRSTVYAFRSGREPSPSTFIKLVEAFDGQRRAQWQTAWTRVADRQADGPAAKQEPGQPDTPAPAIPGTRRTLAAPGRPHRPRLHWSWMFTLTTAVALLILTVTVLRLNDDPAQAESPRPATPVPGAACPQPPLLTPAAVTADDGAISTGISAVTMSYTYTPAFSPMVEYGGGISGPLRTGQHLFLVDWADPASHDSTDAQNPGNGRFYPSPELKVSSGLCFHRPRGEMGYGGFTGMRIRAHLMVVGESQAATFERDGLARDGYTQNDLAARGAVSIGFIDVNTAELAKP